MKMRFLSVVALLQIVSVSEGVTCGSSGRACVSSSEYITCISVDGQYVATTGLTITCPEGQVCKEDTPYPCVDGVATNSPVASCGPSGRKCISSKEYITCISVDGEYIATTGQITTCLEGQVCREDTPYPCVDDVATDSPAGSCSPLGRKCISSNEYITCISVDGEYIATSGQIITCLEGQVCREDTSYPCVDDVATDSPAGSCGPLGRKCISSNEYITCTCVDGKYVATTGQVITCFPGQVCREDTTYGCVDANATTSSTSTTKATPSTTTSTTSTTKATPATTKSTTSATTKATPSTTKSTSATTKATPTTTKSSTTTTPTTTAPIVVPTAPTCTEDSTFPGPQCNQYYHCFAVMWWWSYEILTCPTDQAYDETLGQCVPSSTCNV